MHSQDSWHHHFFNHCQALFCIVSFEGCFREVNIAWQDILGYVTHDVVTNCLYLDLVHPDDVEETNKYIEQLSTGASSVIFTNRYRNQRNQYHEILWHATLSPMEYAFCAIGIDMTTHEELIHPPETSSSPTAHSLNLFKSIVETMDEAVIINRVNGELTYMNPAYKALFKYSYQETNQHHYLNDCSAATTQLIHQKIMPELLKGQSWEGELIIYEGQQYELVLYAYFDVIRNNQEQIVNTFVLFQDVTQFIENQRQLNYQQAQYAQLLDTIPLAILYKDKENNIIQTNQYAAQLLNYSIEKLTGLSLQQLSPDFANQHYSHDLEVIKTGKTMTDILEKYADRYWQVVKTPYQDANEQVLGVIVFGIDMTAQFEIEKALQSEKQLVRYEREQFETIFHSAPLMIVYKDRKNNIIRINQYAAQLFGSTPTELEGISIDDLVDEEAKQYYQDDLEVMRSGKSKLGTIEKYNRRYWQIDRIPYIDSVGKITGVINFGLDITQYLTLEEKLKENQYALQESEMYLNLVMKRLPIMINAVDENDYFVLWNEECERVTGYCESEIVGNPDAWKLLYPNEAYRKDILATKHTMIQNYGEFRGWELTITCKDKTTRMIEWSATNSVQVDNFYLWCVGLETTDRGQMLEQLCENEERLRLLVENMPVMLNAYNENGELIVWNRQCEKVTGYQANEMVGNSEGWVWLYPNTTYRRQIQERLLQNEEYFQQEARLMCRNGAQKYIAWSSVAKQFPISGWSTWIIGEDVTAFKNMQKFFVKNNTLLSTALDHINVGICVTDGRQHIVYANRLYCQLHGYTVEELVGHPFVTIMTAKSSSFVFRHYFSFLAGAHDGFFNEPYMASTRQGKLFKVQLVAHRVTQENGQAFVLWTVTQL